MLILHVSVIQLAAFLSGPSVEPDSVKIIDIVFLIYQGHVGYSRKFMPEVTSFIMSL